MPTALVEATLRRWRGLSHSTAWLQHWEDLSRVMLPRRAGFVGTKVDGASRTEDIFDGTAMNAARALANTVGSVLRPEGEPWFFLHTAEDEDETTDEAREWLADTEERLRRAFDDPRARFRQATGEVDLDLVVFGTAIVFLREIVGRRQLLLQSVHLKDGIPFWGEDGRLEGMFRSRFLTIRQAATRFGEKRLSDPTRKLIAEKKLDQTVEFLFAVMPRAEAVAGSRLAVNMPFADVVIEVTARHEVMQGGFIEFPYIVPRWDTSSGETYGRSPGMYALPNANSSQAIGETMLVAGQRAADPPLLAPSDAFIDAPNTFPGGIAGYEAEAVRDLGANPIRLLEGGRNFPLTFDIQKGERDQVESALLRQLFRLPAAGPGSKMTATEIVERREEFIRETGPVFGRMETDYSAPMVENAFNIILRAGGFRPIPEALSERSVRFEYESPITRIRERMFAAAAREWALDQAALEEVRPGAFDIVDTDALGRITAKANGVPNQIVRAADAVERIRTERAEQQQAAQQIELAEKAADGAARLMKAAPQESA